MELTTEHGFASYTQARWRKFRKHEQVAFPADIIGDEDENLRRGIAVVHVHP